VNRSIAMCCVALTLLPALAWAKKGKPRVLLIDIPPEPAFPANVTKTLNDFLAGALSDQGFEVLTNADIAAVIGVEKQKELLGCTDGSCLADLGGALGADYLVRGNMAVLDADSAVALTLVDSRGKPLGSARKVVSGRSSSALLKALEDLVPKLMAPIRPAPPPQLTATTSAPPAGGLTASGAASPDGSNSTLAYAALGVGGAALVASGILGLLSYSSYQSYYTQAGTGASATKLSSTQSTSNLEAGVAWGGLAVGIAGAALGGYLLMSGGTSSPGSPR
jgi:hypothetical protein